MSESTDSEEVISMSTESQSGRLDGTSPSPHRHSRQNLPSDARSSLSAWLPGAAAEGSGWTGAGCFETLCSKDRVAGFVWGELGALVDCLSGSGSLDGVAVELRDFWMKLKLELKESCGED